MLNVIARESSDAEWKSVNSAHWLDVHNRRGLSPRERVENFMVTPLGTVFEDFGFIRKLQSSVLLAEKLFLGVGLTTLVYSLARLQTLKSNIRMTRMFNAVADGISSPAVHDGIGEVTDAPQDTEIQAVRSFDEINPPVDPIPVARSRLGPCTKRMLARIRIRFGVPKHNLANEEMVRRFVYQSADVYRGIRDSQLSMWISTVVALAFVPTTHDVDLRRMLTGHLSLMERFVNFVTWNTPVHKRMKEYEMMLQQ